MPFCIQLAYLPPFSTCQHFGKLLPVNGLQPAKDGTEVSSGVLQRTPPLLPEAHNNCVSTINSHSRSHESSFGLWKNASQEVSATHRPTLFFSITLIFSRSSTAYHCQELLTVKQMYGFWAAAHRVHPPPWQDVCKKIIVKITCCTLLLVASCSVPP